ncbi:hypothetical protein T12_4269 [Trichinella patagoniensis]|uniref:Uncharacterized protein n=1 Tax=Trichinella patagoniensis TaxID=990121 RepID=A0A0V1A5S6_9BILA|nr:hypothetical protein T12_4269 [Trichinella patagoniensis]
MYVNLQNCAIIALALENLPKMHCSKFQKNRTEISKSQAKPQRQKNYINLWGQIWCKKCLWRNKLRNNNKLLYNCSTAETADFSTKKLSVPTVLIFIRYWNPEQIRSS